MNTLLAEFEPLEHSGSPFELVLLGVGALITLALLVGFIVLLTRAGRKE